LLGVTGNSDVLLGYLGMIPEWQDSDAPVRFDGDSEWTVRETPSGLGHPVELRAYRHRGVLHLDWWYDVRKVPAGTADALAEQFPATLMQVIGEALLGDAGADDADAEDDDFTMIDLSAAVLDDDE
jgi:phthiocerol/phenolphthiocerol synthesis type-I polyketide synthase E